MKKQTSREFITALEYSDQNFDVDTSLSVAYEPTHERKCWLKVNVRIVGHEHVATPIVVSVDGCDQPYAVECPADGTVNDFRAVSVQGFDPLIGTYGTPITFSAAFSWTTERDVAVPGDAVHVEVWIETDGAHHWRLDRRDSGAGLCLADNDL